MSARTDEDPADAQSGLQTSTTAAWFVATAFAMAWSVSGVKAAPERWPRSSEQLSPICKWTAGGLQTDNGKEFTDRLFGSRAKDAGPSSFRVEPNSQNR